MYQKDHALPAHNAFYHRALYVKALEVVRLGDSPYVESYEIAMHGFDKLDSTLSPYADIDGNGL